MGFFDILGLLNPENLKNKAKDYIKRKYNRTLEFDDLSLGLSEIKLSNVRISEEGGFENGTFLSAQKAFVKIDIKEALNKNIDIKALRFEEVSLILIRQAGGEFNFSGFLPKKSGAQPNAELSSLAKGWSVKAGDISLVKGIITFKDVQSGRIICLKGINSSAEQFSFCFEKEQVK